jgi:hypothetical protein
MGVEERNHPFALATPEPRKGSPKVNFPSRQRFSIVESANIGAFE